MVRERRRGRRGDHRERCCSRGCAHVWAAWSHRSCCTSPQPAPGPVIAWAVAHEREVTYRRVPLAVPAKLPVFTAITVGGKCRQITWAEETVQLKDYGDARQITLFEHGKVALQILTSDFDSCPAEIPCWLKSRWREENFLKYASENYGPAPRPGQPGHRQLRPGPDRGVGRHRASAERAGLQCPAEPVGAGHERAPDRAGGQMVPLGRHHRPRRVRGAERPRPGRRRGSHLRREHVDHARGPGPGSRDERRADRDGAGYQSRMGPARHRSRTRRASRRRERDAGHRSESGLAMLLTSRTPIEHPSEEPR